MSRSPKRSPVAQFVKVLEEQGSLEYSIIFAATASILRRCSNRAVHRLQPWANISAITAFRGHHL